MTNTVRELLDSLASRFPDIHEKEKVVAALAALALTEWDEWFAGTLRPRSLAVLALERIKKVFLHPDLYAGREVTRGLLFNASTCPTERLLIWSVCSPNLISRA